jgi:hypothetical protein
MGIELATFRFREQRTLKFNFLLISVFPVSCNRSNKEQPKILQNVRLFSTLANLYGSRDKEMCQILLYNPWTLFEFLVQYLYFFYCMSKLWPPLWYSGQSYWLQIQRSVFDSRSYQTFWEILGMEQGPLGLVSTTKALVERKSSGSGLENQIYGRRDPSRWPRGILYRQNFALTSPKSGGRSISIVRSRTQAMEFFLSVTYNFLMCVLFLKFQLLQERKKATTAHAKNGFFYFLFMTMDCSTFPLLISSVDKTFCLVKDRTSLERGTRNRSKRLCIKKTVYHTEQATHSFMHLKITAASFPHSWFVAVRWSVRIPANLTPLSFLSQPRQLLITGIHVAQSV